MKKIAFLTALFAALIIGIISCSKDESPNPAEGTPKITGFTPESGPVGTQITITGTDFGTTASANTVKIGTATATVSSASATQLTAIVPEGATTGKVSVTVGSSTATGNDFTVTTESAVEVLLNKSELTLYPLPQYAEQLSVISEIGTNTIIWNSSNPTVATVNDNGLVTPLAAGNTTITATVAGISAIVNISVNHAVFVAGQVVLNTTVIPTLWVNGNQTDLPVQVSKAEAQSVFVGDNGDVNVVGSSFFDDAYIWVNGERQELSNSGKALSVFMNGTNVYATGYLVDQTDAHLPVLWENGVAQVLPFSANNAAYAYGTSVFADDNGEVYVSGYSVSDSFTLTATLWANEVEQALTDGSSNSVANSLFISEESIYVCGYEVIDGIRVATLWVDEIAEALADASNRTEANSVFVDSNGDVYVAGVQTTEQSGIATLWVNGIATSLTDGTSIAEAKSVCLDSSGNVYVVGTDDGIPTLWINGEATVLSNIPGEANSVFVK